jgi:hypothetical protein
MINLHCLFIALKLTGIVFGAIGAIFGVISGVIKISHKRPILAGAIAFVGAVLFVFVISYLDCAAMLP